MFYLKVNNNLYPAIFSGKMVDKEWDDRSSKTITLLNSNYNEVNSILQDGTEWIIREENELERQKIDPESGELVFTPGEVLLDREGNIVYDENGNVMHIPVPVMETVVETHEYTNEGYTIKGDVTVHPDGSISVKMGKITELEEAYELLYGGEE